MINVKNLVAIAALLSVPAITLAFDNNGSDTSAATAAAETVVSEASEAEQIEMQRELWKSYASTSEAVDTYAADYSDAGNIEELRTVYVVGQGMTLTK